MAKKKPARKKTTARRSAAATGRKKTTAKKASGRSTSRAKSVKKSSAKKKTSATKKRTAAKKKTAPNKKTAPKKKSAAKKSAAKKKTAAKKTAAKKKATTKKKSPAKKKTSNKKVVAKKKSNKKVAAKEAPKKTTGKAGAKKSSTKKKRSGRRSLGARSVAEAASAGEADAQGYVYVNGRRVRMISTKGQGLVKKTRTANTLKTADAEPEGPTKPVKTSLTAKELRHYRAVLLEKRGELFGDVSAMETAALESRGGNLSNLPIHMADIGSDTYDQDFMLSLAETERKRLHEIDDALKRIQDKTYGVCQMTGNPIPTARLDAKPWAKYTIEAARALERQEWRA